MKKQLLITGGAGFVGSSLAIYLKQKHPDWDISALDNLKRRGSELALSRLKQHRIEFIHGDVRNREDLAVTGKLDLLIECSAEPSVQAGYAASPDYLINSNLSGALNCLEVCRKHSAGMIFLSSSRIYPIDSLRGLPLADQGQRLDIPTGKKGPGWSRKGISVDFPLTGARSLYGTTKYSAELFIQEYMAAYGLKAVINRCGVLTGPWQMGKVDQGFVTLWASRFQYGGKLAYRGFGGTGKQVRDILHVADLCRLVELQIMKLKKYSGQVFNVGGGRKNSTSLLELTDKCSTITGRSKVLTQKTATHPSDIPYYISDNTAVSKLTGWQPEYSIDDTLDDIFRWLIEFKTELKPIL